MKRLIKGSTESNGSLYDEAIKVENLLGIS